MVGSLATTRIGGQHLAHVLFVDGPPVAQRLGVELDGEQRDEARRSVGQPSSLETRSPAPMETRAP